MLKTSALRALALYLRHSPFEKGRYRLLSLATPLLRELSPQLGRRVVRTKYGFSMNLDLTDWIPQRVYLTGEFESTSSKLMAAILKPGDIVVDVGANNGYFSLLCARLVGPHGHVFAVEPNPEIRQELEQNLRLNTFTNVEVLPVALSREEGVAELFLGPARNTGLSSLRPLKGATRTLQVRTAPLDRLIPDRLASIALVKIDVEGAEIGVLRGMERCLEVGAPPVIIEVSPTFLAGYGGSAEELFSLMQSHGYAGYEIGTDVLIPVNRRRQSPGRGGQFNAFFTCAPLGNEPVPVDFLRQMRLDDRPVPTT